MAEGGRVAVATIAAKRLLPSARVVARSCRAQHPDWPVFLLLADEVERAFDPAHEPAEVVFLPEVGHPNWSTLAFSYEQQGLSYALTPTVIRHVLDLGFERVLFIKQESFVVGSLSGVVDALDEHDIVLTPHLLQALEGDDATSRELEILLSGAFNGGIVGVGESATTRAFLQWWEERLRTECRHDVANGLHYEQRWLDLVPSLFEGVGLLRDPGVNVGHWNLPERRVQLDGDRVLVDGGPGSLVRFSGFDAHDPEVLTRYNRRLSADRLGGIAVLLDRYRAALEGAGYHEARAWSYAYDHFDDGTAIPADARARYRGLGDGADQFDDPFASGPGSYLAWLREPEAAGDVPRFWSGIHAARPDLGAAFPDPAGVDRGAFLQWIQQFGRVEHGVGPGLLPVP